MTKGRRGTVVHHQIADSLNKAGLVVDRSLDPIDVIIRGVKYTYYPNTNTYTINDGEDYTLPNGTFNNCKLRNPGDPACNKLLNPRELFGGKKRRSTVKKLKKNRRKSKIRRTK